MTDTPAPFPNAIVTIEFQDAAQRKYASNLTPTGVPNPEQYAKLIAETVERTVLLHVGALPVLAPVEEEPATPPAAETPVIAEIIEEPTA